MEIASSNRARHGAAPPGLPDITISARDLFRIDADL
jgi:hypothetical protein